MSDLTRRLEEEEGRKRSVYKDSLGFYTIGVGCLVDERKAGGLQDNEINFIRDNRIAQTEAYLEKAYPWLFTLDDVRHWVMVSMCFQLGPQGLANFKKFLAAMAKSDWPTAAAEMKDSLWYTQTGGRAERQRKEILTGEYQWRS